MRRTMDILPEVETIRVEANGITFEVDTMGKVIALSCACTGFLSTAFLGASKCRSSRS